ncbi:MAG: hypothetical protein HOD97_06610 [Candidatus Marinimicrobia bacterium]|jgi:UDP-N-acetylglucosamine--N-acetylmuramyl-(pentapeptide) pyrophosphoryl-undecaprenol N-acetylglucosamine transferase|nr:hypothetical protein [Candidatus Neomarinimicrobiota bacterium]MBT3617199.1 hypothetical protein [Candidatus Neomarinimicrobiota bacterium]MBT3829764.1 hypothetical protein [Candidatus Neomarinimicrobiota bacterium]MBT3997889.1 hypothetical protein [Candidatus Neomarinimicrobiota bacterium]MBT4281267.1 hypothetical protein [Candidatus Neomarinimicrobiota bacterium]
MIAAQNYDLDPKKKTLLIFGGSQGSALLNKTVSESVKLLEKSKIQFLWQTGKNQYDQLKSFESDFTRVLPFIDDMGSAYALADLALCRAGALTISELTLCGVPALFVPLSNAAGDHQKKNASVMEKEGAAIVCNEDDFTSNIFSNQVIGLLKNENQLFQMSEKSQKLGKPNAVKDITNHIMELVHA